jgi:hypothetical protein
MGCQVMPRGNRDMYSWHLPDELQCEPESSGVRWEDAGARLQVFLANCPISLFALPSSQWLQQKTFQI